MRQAEQQRTVSGNSPETLSHPEGPAQTFEVGEVVTLNGSGQVIVSPTPAAGSILGVAAVNASGVTGKPCPVWIANDDTLFGFNMPAATQATVGTLVQIVKAAGKWVAQAGTGGVFLVQEIGQSLPPGAVIVRGKFAESLTQLSKIA